MNLQILKWLIAHREVLAQVLEIAKGWRKDLPIVEQWNIVDRIARIVIPVLTKEDIRAMYDMAYHGDEVAAFNLGNEYAALGLDWSQVVSVLLPLLRVVLFALESMTDDNE